MKEIFNAVRIRHIAGETAAVFAGFDSGTFIDLCLDGIDGLSLMARLGRVAEAFHATLPRDYHAALDILGHLAPRLDSAFVSMVLPDYVARYGQDDFDASMAALKYFTVFGSSEFAVRHFLRREPARSLAIMESWARDDNDHVRRLASEGSRPRLPWSFKLDAVIADPSLTWPIVDALKSDPSRYVRKSVANHLNDVAKDHPDWVLARIEGWPLDDPATGWIARHALRTLVKRGNQRALAILGAERAPQVEVGSFTVTPRSIELGESVTLTIELRSTAPTDQRLVVDYAVHYIKSSGAASPKVFKLRTIDLAPAEQRTLTHRQVIRDFTTRKHFPGRHRIDLLLNGRLVAAADFDLNLRPQAR